jgi:S-adenosylmethionine:tRNA ribosyltransferase-isomerase
VHPHPAEQRCGALDLGPRLVGPANPSVQTSEAEMAVSHERAHAELVGDGDGLTEDVLRARGVELHELTLHVGPGTFRPIKVPEVEAHTLPPERISIPPSTADAVNRARAEGRRVIAVGTTTTRALEGVAGADGQMHPLDGEAGLYITPGYRFRMVDALLTNFHLPRSSLLVLVAAFAGRELVLKAYEHAIHAGYRFYSYGDATLIL